MDDLIVIEEIKAVDVYSADGVDKVLAKIAEKARALVFDVNSAKGRKDMASMAYKVSRSKTLLDNLGKGLVDDWKAKAKVIDNQRSTIRTSLDALRDEINKPLDDWKAKEKERVDKHEQAIAAMVAKGNAAVEHWMALGVLIMQASLKEIEDIEINESWEEYESQADETRLVAIAKIKKAIEEREKYDSEQAELERLRKDAADREEAEAKAKTDREQKERDDKIRREAEESAAKKVEREKQDAIDAKEKAEREAREAKEAADKKAADAVQAEKDRVERERQEKEKADKKLAKDRQHTGKILTEVKEKLMDCTGLDEKMCKAIVKVIAKGKLPHVSIKY